MDNWDVLGKIVYLQVQVKSMKEKLPNGQKIYKPEDALVQVNEVQIDQDGITALIDGETVIDKHNARHPSSHNNGSNPVSVGFTGHYKDIQAQFGDHIAIGLAGENIVVDADKRISLADLDIAFRTAKGQFILLKDLYAMPPCEPFTRYCYNHSDLEASQVKSGLQFLSEGTRGFAGMPTNEQPISLFVGDEMLVRRR